MTLVKYCFNIYFLLRNCNALTRVDINDASLLRLFLLSLFKQPSDIIMSVQNFKKIGKKTTATVTLSLDSLSVSYLCLIGTAHVQLSTEMRRKSHSLAVFPTFRFL